MSLDDGVLFPAPTGKQDSGKNERDDGKFIFHRIGLLILESWNIDDIVTPPQAKNVAGNTLLLQFDFLRVAPFLFAGWLKAFALGDLEQCFRLGRALF